MSAAQAELEFYESGAEGAPLSISLVRPPTPPALFFEFGAQNYLRGSSGCPDAGLGGPEVRGCPKRRHGAIKVFVELSLGIGEKTLMGVDW